MPPMPPQKFRELVFQLIYGYDMGKSVADDLIPLLAHELAISKRKVTLAHERTVQLQSHLPEIDKKIAQVSKDYTLERIPSVEKNILRLAVFELHYDPQIPQKVAISEAIRLARKFSSANAAKFVNAILDAVWKQEQGQSIDEEILKNETQAFILSEEENNKNASIADGAHS